MGLYDTSISDDARVGIIFTHILNDNREGAQNYFKSQKERFLSENKYNEAVLFINLQKQNTVVKVSPWCTIYFKSVWCSAFWSFVLEFCRTENNFINMKSHHKIIQSK